MQQTRADLAPVVKLALAITLLPVLLDLLLSGASRAFGYTAADTFYYLVVARNVVDHGLLSFDQTHLTNGFHPLWELVCVALVAGVRVLHGSDVHALALVVVVGLAAGTLGIALFGRALREQLGHVPWAFALLPFGLYALAPLLVWLRSSAEVARLDPVVGHEPVFGTCWGFACGMESGLSFAAAAWACLLYVRLERVASHSSLLRIGLVCALLVLARLDHALLILPLLMSLASRIWRDQGAAPVRRIASLASAVALPVLAYLVASYLLTGSALPVSGALKSTFPYPSMINLRTLVEVVLHPEAPALAWYPRAWRLMQLLLPQLAAAAYLAWAARRARGGNPDLGVPLALGMLVLGAYDLAYVPLMQQGHWYFPVSIPGVTLLWLLWLGRRAPAPAQASRSWLMAAAVALGSCLIFLWTQRLDSYHAGFREFFERQAPELRAHYLGREPRLFSIDDGIVAFATGFPTMSGTGLMVDVAALSAAREGRLGDLAIARGYERFTGLGYVDYRKMLDPRTGLPSPRWIDASFGRKLSDPSKFRYSLVYVSKDREFALLRVQPSNQPR